jgi:hypothetical protein
VDEACRIFEEFIPAGCPSEINITSSMRILILHQFSLLSDSQGSQLNLSSIAKDSIKVYRQSQRSMSELDESATLPPKPISLDSVAQQQSIQQVINTRKESLPAALKSSLQSSSPKRSLVPIASTSVDSILDTPWRLPYDCFRKAQQHIFNLMDKDSYVRYLASDGLKALLEREGVMTSNDRDFEAQIMHIKEMRKVY